jgi:uncharacterized protein YdcH (DUF465 family)
MALRDRNKVVVRLKDELDSAIALVTHARESLTNEMNSEWAQKKLSVDDKFLRKLKEMTAAFNSLTESKIRLDKAERAMEADMTLEEEREAVMQYLADMPDGELRSFVARAKELRDGIEPPEGTSPASPSPPAAPWSAQNLGEP